MSVSNRVPQPVDSTHTATTMSASPVMAGAQAKACAGLVRVGKQRVDGERGRGVRGGQPVDGGPTSLTHLAPQRGSRLSDTEALVGAWWTSIGDAELAAFDVLHDDGAVLVVAHEDGARGLESRDFCLLPCAVPLHAGRPVA